MYWGKTGRYLTYVKTNLFTYEAHLVFRQVVAR